MSKNVHYVDVVKINSTRYCKYVESVINRNYIIFLTFLALGCSNDIAEKVTLFKTPLDNILTLELSIGSNEKFDDFLLAQPRNLVVADNGDIIVSDENRLKVFNSSGEPVRIVGRPGNGPAEFGPLAFAFISETGYISVMNPMSNPHYNLFAPDYSFVERRNLQNSEIHKKLKEEFNWIQAYFNSFYVYSPEEIVLFTQADGQFEGGEHISYSAILYLENDQINTIALYESDFSSTSMLTKGHLIFAFLPDRKLVYMNTEEHRYKEDGLWYYRMIVYDLKTHSKREIKRLYNPIIIPEEDIFPEENPYEELQNAEKLYEERSELLRKAKVYPPVQEIISDRNFLFIFTFEHQEDSGYSVDIYDNKRSIFLRRVYFPFIPAVIKNGFAYRMSDYYRNKDFPVVEKFAIDSIVYGK